MQLKVQLKGLITLRGFQPYVSDVRLSSHLDSFLGAEVSLSISTKGLENCYWKGSLLCPLEHHLVPKLQFDFKNRGLLNVLNDVWKVGEKEIPFLLLEGHVCEIIVARIRNSQELRERILKLQKLLRQVREF